MRKRKRVEPRNIAMYSEEWDIVRRLNHSLGFNNTSATIRYIIRDWNRRISDDASPLPAIQVTQLEATP